VEREHAIVAFAVASAGAEVPRGHASIQMGGGTLTLVAPPLLEYPLYYARAPGDAYVLACSRLEPLARLLPQTPLSLPRLLSLIAPGVRDPDAGSTVYAAIRRLIAGERLIAGSQDVTMDRSIPQLGSAYHRGRPEDLAAELRKHLDAAVGRAMGSAKRIAVFASGGLDSSGVLALAAARCARTASLEPTALTVHFSAPGDDRRYFDELVHALKVTPVRISPRDAASWFPRSLCADGQPFQFAFSPLDLTLAAAAVARDSEVTLHGAGGDTMLGGPLPFAQLARRGHLVAAIRAAWCVRLPWPTTPWSRLRSLVVSPLMPHKVVRARRRFAAHARWMTPRSHTVVSRCLEGAERSPRRLPDTPDAWMQALCDDETRLDSADAGAQVLALTGCASIDAFMDWEFVRFVLQIDPLLLSYGHEYKGLYRLAMKGLLPEGLRTRQDKGSLEPGIAAAALGADALEMLHDLASLSVLASRDIVDPLPLRPLVDPWLASIRRGERRDTDPADEHCQPAWQLLSVEAFLREHGPGRDLA
jgi:asparagine synthetase B (glutamine-hydrolysing)